MTFKRGFVHIYTGEGKGKTTSAVGTALRAVRYGHKVYLIQFMKGITEEDTIKNVEGISFKHFGHIRPAGKWKWVHKKRIEEEDKKIANEGVRFAEKIISEGKHDLVILDEIIMTVWFGLVNEEDVLELIKKKPINVELILTGRRASKKLIEVSDYVSDVQKIKHPYDNGVLAREGIDY